MRKRIFNLTVITALFVLASLISVLADNIEDYTLSELNDNILRYHVTSDTQVQNKVKGGEGAQLVYTMAISPHNSDKMLLGNNTSGIWRSADGGKYWEPSSNGIKAQCIDTVVFDPDDENIAYAVAATASNSSNRIELGAEMGLYKSIDGGKNWSFKLSLCNERNIGKLIAFGRKDASGKRVMFAASSNATEYEDIAKGTTGLWRSYDKGETWECIGLEDRSIISLYTESNTDLIIVASDKGIDASYDNGESFKSVNSNLPYTSASVVTVDPENKSHWIAAMRFKNEDNGRCGGVLYETYNSGESWSAISGELFGYDSGCYISSLDYIYVTGKEKPRLLMSVYRMHQPNLYSDDGGKTFKNCEFKVKETYGLYSEYYGFFTLPFCINPNNNNEVYTSLITPYKSTDGGATFEFSGSGYSGFLVKDFHFDANGKVEYMAVTDVGFARMKTDEDTVYSSSYGISDITLPSYVSAKSATSLAVDSNNKEHGFVAMGGYIYATPTTLLETTDGFKTLKPMESFELLNSSRQKTVSSVWYHPQNSNVVYTDYYVSEDNGTSWRETEHQIKGISSFNGDTVYSLDNYKIYISNDKGISWIDTGLTVDNSGKYTGFCVDSFYKDVIWTAEYSTVYRIDIQNRRIDKYYGGKTNFLGEKGKRMEMTGIIQNPKLKNHLLVSARDISFGGSYVYETFDYGINWKKLDCFPHLAYETPIEFHPTENLVFFSGMMGNLVYKWDKSSWDLNGGIIELGYDESTESYKLSASAGSAYYNSPVTLAITGESGTTAVYLETTDDNGKFEFSLNNIALNSGSYQINVSLIDKESYIEDEFFTGNIIIPNENFSAIYNPASKNFVLYGSSEYKETVTFMLKEKTYGISEITDDNFADIVKYVSQIEPEEDGGFVYKFRFEIPDGKSIFDYYINVLNDAVNYKDNPVKIVTNREYNFEITEESEIDFTKGANFKINVNWRYFLENELNTQLFAALFDSEGNLLDVFLSDRTMNFDATKDSVSGVMPENCAELKVFFWSDMYPLGNIKSYKASYKGGEQ